MALLDDLVSQIPDVALRRRLQRAVTDLRRKQKFGLVFEEHIPETMLISGLPSRVGQLVQRRQDGDGGEVFRVVRRPSTNTAVLITSDGTEVEEKASNLLAVKRFGEPMFASLRPLDRINRAGDERPYHAVVNGENFHALQLFAYVFARKADCIYIDPPYNTGARDWKYNNRFVDGNDAWRHSKWLSFMEKRLRLAKRLLKPNGVLIVTVDEHEVSNLGVLLRQTYPTARVQMVTIVMNTAGSMSPGLFSRAEEYAYFCFFGNAKPAPMTSDLLAGSIPVTQFWFPLFRSRGLNDRPSKRPNLVYPIAIDPKTLTVYGAGKSLKERQQDVEVKGDLDKWQPDPTENLDGKPVVWPILDTGEVTTWQVGAPGLMKLVEDGFIRVRPAKQDGAKRPYTLSYVKSGNRKKILLGEIATVGREESGARILEGGTRTTIPKSTWKVPSHDARLYGTTMLRALVGNTWFTYPKSPYAVADTLKTIVADIPDALIVDFFAGSGTTLQSVAMLNREDGGRRRCILVTNNEVADSAASQLVEEGHFRGDREYERHGIFHEVTLPRVEAAITGLRSDGSPVEGEYLDGSAIADGFEENVEFYDLGYLDPDDVELGDQFKAIHPLLWMAAGGSGERDDSVVPKDFYIAPKSTYAVLFKPSRLKRFLDALEKRPDVTHTWVVTDSEEAYAETCEALPKHVSYTSQLYGDYLRTFRVNGRRLR